MTGALAAPFSFVGMIRVMPFDFDAAVIAPFRMQPGLRRVAPGALQLTPAQPDSRALGEKLAVLRQHADQALLAEPDFDPAPALHALCVHAAHEHPHAFGIEGDSIWHARTLGWSLHGTTPRDAGGAAEIGDGLRALPAHQRLSALLALAFEQDFAILDAASGRVPWLAVCLPSHWAPQDKVGRRFAEIHAPVADNAVLIAASEALVRLVTGDERWERFVWTISADANLQQHPQRSPRVAWVADAPPDALAAQAFFRTEHQTFIPLPALQQAIFTIHVESRPLVQAIDSAERARRLRAALASMSPAVLAYRGLTDAQPRLLEWLDRSARRSEGSHA
jgi:hypothetical protein